MRWRTSGIAAFLGAVSCLLLPPLAAGGSAGTAGKSQGVDLQLAGDAASRVAWLQVFGTGGDDWVNELQRLRDGRVMAVGFLDRRDDDSAHDWRAFAARLDDVGAVVESHEYGVGGGIDSLWNVIEADDGRRAYAGFTTRIGARGINGYSLVARADGSILKENAHGGDGYDRFTDIALAADGYVLAGHSQRAGEDKRRVFIAKTDRDGLPVWERIFEADGSSGALYVEAAGDGGFIVAGGIDVDGQSDVLVMKIDGEGRELWKRTAGSAAGDDINHGLVLHADGRIVVVGYSTSWGARDHDFFAATLSPTGELMRQEIFGGAGDERAILATADPQGRVWVVGSTTSAGAGKTDVLVARLGADGGFEPAAMTLGSAADETGTAILPMADGALLVAGYGSAFGHGRQDAFVVRLEAPAWDRPHSAFVRTSGSLEAR